MDLIPKETFAEVCLYLGSYRDCVNLLCLVCKKWRGFLNDPYSHTILIARKYPDIDLEYYKKAWQYNLIITSNELSREFTINKDQLFCWDKLLQFFLSSKTRISIVAKKKTFLICYMAIRLNWSLPYPIFICTWSDLSKIKIEMTISNIMAYQNTANRGVGSTLRVINSVFLKELKGHEKSIVIWCDDDHIMTHGVFKFIGNCPDVMRSIFITIHESHETKLPGISASFA